MRVPGSHVVFMDDGPALHAGMSLCVVSLAGIPALYIPGTGFFLAPSGNVRTRIAGSAPAKSPGIVVLHERAGIQTHDQSLYTATAPAVGMLAVP